MSVQNLVSIHMMLSLIHILKEIIKGETDAPLGREEEKAVRIALGLEKPEN